jgi:hypothetical protein
MDETFLVLTIKAVVRGVKVRHQNATEIAKDLLRGFSFGVFPYTNATSSKLAKTHTYRSEPSIATFVSSAWIRLPVLSLPNIAW